MVGLIDLGIRSRDGFGPLGHIVQSLRRSGDGEEYRLRFLSKEIKAAVDPQLFQTILVRSTSSSMCGILFILMKNPELCKLVWGVEYHLTPNAAPPDVGAEAKVASASEYPSHCSKFSGAMEFLRSFRDYEDIKSLNNDFLDRLQRGHSKPFDYDDLHRCEKGRPGDSTAMIMDNYRFSQNTFYDQGLDFIFLARHMLGSQRFPDLRWVTVSSWADEKIHKYWEWYPEQAPRIEQKPGAPLNARDVFKWPEPGYCPKHLHGPAKRAFYVVLYGLFLRNFNLKDKRRVRNVSFQWLPTGLDSEPTFWRLWAPKALRKVTHFSCLNISNQISETWMYDIFRSYILYSINWTVQNLNIGYSRWTVPEPASRNTSIENHNKRKQGGIIDNVPSLLTLLKLYEDNETIEPLKDRDSNNVGRQEARFVTRHFPRLTRLHLKPWQEVASLKDFEILLDDSSKYFPLLQHLHLEGLHLSRQYVWADLDRCAEAEENPRIYEVEQPMIQNGVRGGVINYKAPWVDVIEEIRGCPRLSVAHSTEPVYCTVTHDNLWEDTIVGMPGGEPWNPRHQQIVSWSRCWSWIVNHKKARSYFERSSTHLPWISADQIERGPPPSPQTNPNRSSQSINLSPVSPMQSPVASLDYPISPLEFFFEGTRDGTVNHGVAEHVERGSIRSTCATFGDVRDRSSMSSSRRSSGSTLESLVRGSTVSTEESNVLPHDNTKYTSLITTMENATLGPIKFSQSELRPDPSAASRWSGGFQAGSAQDTLTWWER